MTGPARVGVAGLAVLLTATGVARAAPPPGSSREDRRIYHADQLVDNASKRVERDRACRFRPPERGPVDAAPSSVFLDSLAALRRPARPDENIPFPLPSTDWATPSVYAGYTRILSASDGTSFQVFPLHDVSRSSPRPKRCVARLRLRVRRAAADRSPAFKREVKRSLRRTISNEWAPRRREGMIVIANRTIGVSLDLAFFRRHGAFILRGGFSGPEAMVQGVVPDGVASIDFTFGEVHHVSAAVSDNTVALTTPLTLSQTMPARQVWRAADGHVIRVVSGL